MEVKAVKGVATGGARIDVPLEDVVKADKGKRGGRGGGGGGGGGKAMKAGRGGIRHNPYGGGGGGGRQGGARGGGKILERGYGGGGYAGADLMCMHCGMYFSAAQINVFQRHVTQCVAVTYGAGGGGRGAHKARPNEIPEGVSEIRGSTLMVDEESGRVYRSCNFCYKEGKETSMAPRDVTSFTQHMSTKHSGTAKPKGDKKGEKKEEKEKKEKKKLTTEDLDAGMFNYFGTDADAAAPAAPEAKE